MADIPMAGTNLKGVPHAAAAGGGGDDMELEDGEMPPPPPPPPPPSSSYGAGDQQHAGYGNGYGQQQQAYGGYGDQQQQQGYGYGGYGAAAGGQQQQQQQVCGWVSMCITSVGSRSVADPLCEGAAGDKTVPDVMCASCWCGHSTQRSSHIEPLLRGNAHLPSSTIPLAIVSPGRRPTQMAEPAKGASWGWGWGWLTVLPHAHAPPSLDTQRSQLRHAH